MVNVNNEYLAIGFAGKGFKGHLDKDEITKTLNTYANQGWEVKSSTAVSSGGYMELVVILERPKS